MSTPSDIAIDSGEMNRRLIVEWLDDTARDAIGAPVPEWREYARTWARITPLTGRELLQAQQINSELTVKIECRYVRGLTTKHRFVDIRGNNRQVYEIGMILDVGMRQTTNECQCKTGRMDGRYVPETDPAMHAQGASAVAATYGPTYGPVRTTQ